MSRLKTLSFDTPLGSMLAISDEEALYLLEFADYFRLEREIERLKRRTKATIVAGSTHPIASIQTELKSYFEGQLKEFKTLYYLLGTSFQKMAWTELLHIPYGETRSYAEQAERIGKPSAHRAVANANGANQLAIIIPCHRIISSDGTLGGYGGGIARKKWLLELERGL